MSRTDPVACGSYTKTARDGQLALKPLTCCHVPRGELLKFGTAEPQLRIVSKKRLRRASRRELNTLTRHALLKLCSEPFLLKLLANEHKLAAARLSLLPQFVPHQREPVVYSVKDSAARVVLNPEKTF